MARKKATETDSERFTLKDLAEAEYKLMDLLSDPQAPGPNFWSPEGERVLETAIEEVVQVVIHLPRQKRPLKDMLAHAEGESLRGACLKFEAYWKTKDRSQESDLVAMSELEVAASRFLVMAA